MAPDKGQIQSELDELQKIRTRGTHPSQIVGSLITSRPDVVNRSPNITAKNRENFSNHIFEAPRRFEWLREPKHDIGWIESDSKMKLVEWAH